jgi:crossover junction endodeoxyribonuclease RusA
MNNCFSWKTIGVPAPQGSKRHVGNGRMIEASKALKPWRELIIADAKPYAAELSKPLDTPIGISLVFVFPRPKNHFTTNGQVKGNAPKYKTSRPDLDKCTRAVLDSLVLAGLLKDDSLVYSLSVYKRYAGQNEQPGVSITVMDSETLPFQ